MSFDSDKNKQNSLFPMVCGLAIGSMPALLWLPLVGRLMQWLLRNGYIMAFFIFANYLPWMIGYIIGRVFGLPTFIPVVFCIVYWLFLGSIAGKPKHFKMAMVYIGTAHLLIPLVFYLLLVYPRGDAGFPFFEIEPLIRGIFN